MKTSTGLRNTMLGTSNLKSALAGGQMMFYSGTVPTDADQALGSAVLLCTLKNAGAGINFDAPASGILPKAAAETWSGTNVAAGVATFWRFVLSSDTGALSTTALRLQGTIAVAGADINLTSTSLSSGATQGLDFFSVALPTG